MPKLSAQGAADPNAIDLSGSMDTIAVGNDLSGFLNIGRQNSDQWEDFIIKGNSDSATIRYGGDLILDSSPAPCIGCAVGCNPVLFGDFNGDGIGDIIDALFNAVYLGVNSSMHFGSSYSSRLAFHGSLQRFIGAVHFDQVSFTDLLSQGSDGLHNFILRYTGSKEFGSMPFMFANDSLVLDKPSLYAMWTMVTGEFRSVHESSVLFTDGPRTYMVNMANHHLHDNPIKLISDSANGGIVVKSMYATDITGDGVTDLIVSDGLRLYIFKGDESFGTVALSPENAFYTIKSPRLTDFGNYGFLNPDFGLQMRAVGDLSGSGVPYLAVTTSQSAGGISANYIFFYAGGKALDSLFDASIKIECNGLGNIDTLHTINTSGRTVCLVNDFLDANANHQDLDLLVSRNCETIPHRTNPAMDGSVLWRSPEQNTVVMSPSLADKFSRCNISTSISGDGTLTVFNLLGNSVAKRAVILDGNHDIAYFNTEGWPTGTYVVRLEINGFQVSTKFIVHH
ncbi:MAG: T9SS type A sorting domain-containing protein [Bacteroidetes bacterium]|nr:T9SS type A sorting domain-containing protein [Bacteroidota bacterium]